MVETSAASIGETGQVASVPMARHIAQVAARLFAARGYDATSVREIVAAAGVTKPTLYYHFGSKEGLAQALVTVPMSRLLEAMRGLLARDCDPRETLAALIDANFSFCRDDPDRARLVYALFFGPLGSGLAAELGRFGKDLTAVWTAAAQRLGDAGWIKRERVRDCAVNLRGLIVIHTMDYLYRDVPLGADLPRRLVDDLLRGVGPVIPEKG